MAEEYVGVKFSVSLRGAAPNVASDSRATELCEWSLRFHDLGMRPDYRKRDGGTASAGNLSYRLRERENAFVITPAGAPAVGLEPSELVLVDKVDEARRVVYARGGAFGNARGALAPSSESIMHYAVYAARRDVNAVFHGHSAEILRAAQRLNLAQTKRFEEYGTLELAREATASLGKRGFLVLKEHGFLSVGAEMREAGEQAMRLREKAIK